MWLVFATGEFLSSILSFWTTYLNAKMILKIYHRCGSKRHNLSRCKKPSNPADPYPYASCFVCKGKGHLASTCPQNKSKGVYPNGGSCKLCGDTSHLAKNCGVRQKSKHCLLNLLPKHYWLLIYISQSGRLNSSVRYRP